MVYLGVILDSISFRVSPALKRVEKLLSIGDVFLSCEKQPVSSWLELLGVLSSVIRLVPGGWLRMRSLQFTLRRSWDQVDQSALVLWTPEIRLDLERWLDRERLELGVALDQVSPQLDLWSDASDVHLREEGSSGRWSPEELDLSINARELLAIERALLFFAPQIKGGTRSQLLNAIAQRILQWSETLPVQLTPQFIMGRHNVHAGSLSRPTKCWLQNGHSRSRFFKSFGGGGRCLSTFLPPHSIANVVHIFLRSTIRTLWLRLLCSRVGMGGRRMPFHLIAHSDCSQEAPVILWGPADHHSSLLASEAVVSGPSGSGCGRSGGSSSVQRSSASTTLPSSSSGSVRAVASCLETIQRFACAWGFSKHVAKQVALARHPSSRVVYQAKWSIYRRWCHSEGHSVSRPSLSKIADFLFWLRRSKKLCLRF